MLRTSSRVTLRSERKHRARNLAFGHPAQSHPVRFRPPRFAIRARQRRPVSGPYSFPVSSRLVSPIIRRLASSSPSPVDTTPKILWRLNSNLPRRSRRHRVASSTHRTSGSIPVDSPSALGHAADLDAAPRAPQKLYYKANLQKRSCAGPTNDYRKSRRRDSRSDVTNTHGSGRRRCWGGQSVRSDYPKTLSVVRSRVVGLAIEGDCVESFGCTDGLGSCEVDAG